MGYTHILMHYIGKICSVLLKKVFFIRSTNYMIKGSYVWEEELTSKNLITTQIGLGVFCKRTNTPTNFNLKLITMLFIKKKKTIKKKAPLGEKKKKKKKKS